MWAFDSLRQLLQRCRLAFSSREAFQVGRTVGGDLNFRGNT